ncbi:MAG TPA: DUF1049 domain-containing protein [Rhodospirillaceae bacterium]|nr:DUF1049 domain-containing protein [Rhodospirillaceae bacterium]
MKLLFWLVGLPLAAVTVLFALSNRQAVTLALWPLDEALVIPVYLAALLPALAGFLLGLLMAGGRKLGEQAETRRQAQSIRELRRQLEESRQVNQVPSS